MRIGKLLLGLMAGLATGTVLGILFAPDKGVNTRNRIYKKGQDLGDELESSFDDFIRKSSDEIASAHDNDENSTTSTVSSKKQNKST